MSVKGSAEVPAKLGMVLIAIVVVVVGYFLWSKTGKRAVAVPDKNEFQAAYNKANANRPGMQGGGSGGGTNINPAQMQEAMEKMRAGGGQPTGGGTR